MVSTSASVTYVNGVHWKDQHQATHHAYTACNCLGAFYPAVQHVQLTPPLFVLLVHHGGLYTCTWRHMTLYLLLVILTWICMRSNAAGCSTWYACLRVMSGGSGS